MPKVWEGVGSRTRVPERSLGHPAGTFNVICVGRNSHVAMSKGSEPRRKNKEMLLRQVSNRLQTVLEEGSQEDNDAQRLSSELVREWETHICEIRA